MLFHALHKLQKNTSSYNLAARSPIHVRAMIDLLVQQTNSQSKISEIQFLKSSFTINVENIQQEFGFTPATTNEILNRFVASHSKI